MQFVNEQDAATLERFIARLEFRATDPTFVAYGEAYLALIDLPHAAAVLDLGCGTGVMARAIAARDDFAGTVTGVDQSPDFIAAAERLAADEGVGDRIEFVVGDAHALDLPAASFDAVVAHTLVSHVRDPLAVLAQAARVTRPGGSVAIFDGDYASLTFGVLGPAARRGDGGRLPVDHHERAAGDARAPAPAAAGRAPAGRHAGPRARGGRDEQLLPQPGRDLRAAGGLDAGSLPAADVDAWLADQRRSAADGTFFAACNYYAYVGRRPHDGRPARARRRPSAAPWGMLAAIDLHGCERGRLADPDAIRRFVATVIDAIGMRAHGPLMIERFGDGELEGWSALQFIETSSITRARRRGRRPLLRRRLLLPAVRPRRRGRGRRRALRRHGHRHRAASDDRHRAGARRARRAGRHRRHDPLRPRHAPRSDPAAPRDVADLEHARDRGVLLPARRRRHLEPAHGRRPGRPHQPHLRARDPPRRGRRQRRRPDHARDRVRRRDRVDHRRRADRRHRLRRRRRPDRRRR